MVGVKCLRNGVVPKSVKVLKTAALSGCFDKHVYMEHLPDVIEDCPFGFSNPIDRPDAYVYVYVHMPEGLLDHNPDWNEYSLVLHRNIEITDSGDDYVTMHFKSGVSDDEHNQLVYYDWVRINNILAGNLSDFEVVDNNTIRLNNASKYMGKTINFEIMLSEGNLLTKYNAVVIQNPFKTYGDFTFEAPKENSERIFFVCKK
jgi:hypothetical protein